jgi:hypothetical protein
MPMRVSEEEAIKQGWIDPPIRNPTPVRGTGITSDADRPSEALPYCIIGIVSWLFGFACGLFI